MKQRNYKMTTEGQWMHSLYPKEVTVENPTPDDYWAAVSEELNTELMTKYNKLKPKVEETIAEGKSFSLNSATAVFYKEEFYVSRIDYSEV